MSRRYLTDKELEAALYEDDEDDLCRDYIDPELQSSDDESDVEQREEIENNSPGK